LSLEHSFQKCQSNALKDQCETLILIRSFHPIIASYVLNGKIFERVFPMTDLGVILDSKLSLREHIDSVVNKGSAMFGFIKRLSRDFRDPNVLKVLKLES
jgi:hypothetical protein